jgi:hypothetical protein
MIPQNSELKLILLKNIDNVILIVFGVQNKRHSGLSCQQSTYVYDNFLKPKLMNSPGF